MPRPRKWRKVCDLPRISLFGPLNTRTYKTEPITMTVDEYESIRLIDWEGMTQEECAERLNVARTTVQRLYPDARKKLSRRWWRENPLRLRAETTSCATRTRSFTGVRDATGTGMVEIYKTYTTKGEEP